MTERIFRSSFLTGVLVLLLSCLLLLTGFYRYHEQQVFQRLAAEAQWVVHGMERMGGEFLQTLDTDDRLTWIAADGTALYDSAADQTIMDNHLGREEVQEAIACGVGQSVRDSDTVMEKTLYHAVRLSDGSVIRLSCRQETAAAALLQMSLPLMLLVVLALLCSALLALRATRQIVRPINEMDLENLATYPAYSELAPFTNRIREQSRTIRRQMDELRTREQELRAITDHMKEGFLLADRRLVILSGNHSAMELLSSGAEAQTLWEERCRDEIRAAAQAALDGERTEVSLQQEGRTYQIVANAVVSDGQVTGVVVIMMDVTEREERDALRREFTANVSHELRTPLTAISGFAELMKEGLVPAEKMREFSGDIYRECSRLITLVDDIIDLSRLDEGSAPLEMEEVSLHMLAEETVESLRRTAEKKGVTLSCEAEETVVFGSHSLLSEMLYNLVDNAIKYNRDGGSVRVAICRSEREVRLAVSDTGIGIPKADQDRVFERFYRVDKSHSRAIGGTGLGLSIVKHAAQYHDARLELESELEKGSTFTVIFKEYTV